MSPNALKVFMDIAKYAKNMNTVEALMQFYAENYVEYINDKNLGANKAKVFTNEMARKMVKDFETKFPEYN